MVTSLVKTRSKDYGTLTDNILRVTLILIFIFSQAILQAQSLDSCERHVARAYSDGTPHVVVFVDPLTMERIKEEVYYENGNLDYEGFYRKGLEHGDWTYYWPNGNVKSKEHYIRGKEDGVMYDFNEKGEKTKEYRYSKGVLIEELTIE